MSVACSDTEWTPSDEQSETIILRSVEPTARVTVLGVNRRTPKKILTTATITIATSKDSLGAPIFYREVDLPFATAVRDPAAHISGRFGEISSKQQPPIVLDRLPVCANCHSFSAEGTLPGMDIDYANDKGSYVLESVAKEMVFEPSKIITWSDYRREDGKTTFGLLSQVSPDGRYVASTVKGQSVFVATEDLAFSQLFFPIKGILAIYDRTRKEFRALPGADDPEFVQSNPSWSPDGKYLIFARSKAYRPNRPLVGNSVLLRREDCVEFLDGRQTMQFDLYRIPFNDGKGGKAEPLRGASLDGMSNFFGRYSPDGKWVVFCKAKSFMLLQPAVHRTGRGGPAQGPGGCARFPAGCRASGHRPDEPGQSARGRGPAGSPHKTSFQLQHAVLYRNLGSGWFEDVSLVTGATGSCANVNWGCGFVDFDNDGHRDLFVGCGHPPGPRGRVRPDDHLPYSQCAALQHGPRQVRRRIRAVRPAVSSRALRSGHGL